VDQGVHGGGTGQHAALGNAAEPVPHAGHHALPPNDHRRR
jgi:hypothetical protein